jgi:hypothetical protein
VLLEDGRPVAVAEVLDLWSGDAAFRAFFVARLRAVPFAAYCWETPPVVASSVGRPFECTFVDSPALARVVADPEPFREHFTGAAAVRFESLGRDALLVAPCPRGPIAPYAHLAAFVRGAPEDQVAALWQEVAGAVRGRIGARPLWLSTAGLGVSWLHVRLDSRPKYYRTRAYARA